MGGKVDMDIICACAVCRGNLRDGDALAENEVWKCGELQYIELAHTKCGIRDNAKRDREYGRDGWRWVTA